MILKEGKFEHFKKIEINVILILIWIRERDEVRIKSIFFLIQLNNEIPIKSSP